MKVKTSSGAVYSVEVVSGHALGPVLRVQKDGHTPDYVVAIFPDRVPFLTATVSTEWDPVRGQVIGRNDRGTITLRFVPTQIRVGMIFANRRGFRSTRIVSIEE